MKTKEFISKAKDLGWGINKTTSTIELIEPINPANYAIASISEVIRNLFETHYYDMLPVGDKTLDLIVAYAKTPIEDRKEPEYKYLVKVLSGDCGFLNVQHIKRCGEEDIIKYSISGKRQSPTIKCSFTKKELLAMREDPGLAIDWDKVWLESAA